MKFAREFDARVAGVSSGSTSTTTRRPTARGSPLTPRGTGCLIVIGRLPGRPEDRPARSRGSSCPLHAGARVADASHARAVARRGVAAGEIGSGSSTGQSWVMQQTKARTERPPIPGRHHFRAKSTAAPSFCMMPRPASCASLRHNHGLPTRTRSRRGHGKRWIDDGANCTEAENCRTRAPLGRPLRAFPRMGLSRQTTAAALS